MLKFRLSYPAASLRELTHVDLLYRLLLVVGSLEVFRQAVDPGHFVLGVPLELVMPLIALVVIQRGISTTITCLLTRKHHALSAQAPLHPQLLGLAFDQIDHVTAKKHLCFSVAILEELLRCNFGLVPEVVYLCMCVNAAQM